MAAAIILLSTCFVVIGLGILTKKNSNKRVSLKKDPAPDPCSWKRNQTEYFSNIFPTEIAMLFGSDPDEQLVFIGSSLMHYGRASCRSCIRLELLSQYIIIHYY